MRLTTLLVVCMLVGCVEDDASMRKVGAPECERYRLEVDRQWEAAMASTRRARQLGEECEAGPQRVRALDVAIDEAGIAPEERAKRREAHKRALLKYMDACESLSLMRDVVHHNYGHASEAGKLLTECEAKHRRRAR